jgi:uncharacterized integral membrane protein
MSEDPTRSTARPDGPPYGRVGPVDPREDPVTRPAMLPADGPGRADASTEPTPYALDERGGPPEHGRPAVRTPLPDAAGDAPTTALPTGRPQPAPALKHTRASGLWTGLILSALVLILLLVFILQNGNPVDITFLGFTGSLPIGVALLFAAIAGLLLVAIPGGLRILQLRRAARRRD